MLGIDGVQIVVVVALVIVLVTVIVIVIINYYLGYSASTWISKPA